MRTTLIALFAAGCTAAAAGMQTPTFRTAARLVQVSVIVHDNDGRAVPGLTADDFRVFENGREQSIAVFSSESTGSLPLPALSGPQAAGTANEFSNRLSSFGTGVTVILLDRLNTQWQDQVMARNEVVRFLNQVRPDDRIALYILDSDSVRILHDFTSDTSSLLRALARHRGRTSGELAPEISEAPEIGDAEFDAWLRETQEKIEAALIENRVRYTASALEGIARHLAGVRGRKNLVWISSAFPLIINDRGIPRSIEREIAPAMRILNDNNVALYPVDARGLLGAFAPGSRPGTVIFNTLSMTAPNMDTMRALAERTGGRAFTNTNDIGRAVRRAIDDARITYLVGYYASDTNIDGRFRSIKVTVKRRGVEVRHRLGYFAVAPERPKESTREDVLMQEVRSPTRATAVPVSARIDRIDGDGTIEVRIRVDPQAVLLERQGDDWVGAVDVFLAQGLPNGTFQSNGYFTFNLKLTQAQRDRILRDGLSETRRVVLRTDAHELHVVARDLSSGALGSLAIPVDKLPKR